MILEIDEQTLSLADLRRAWEAPLKVRIGAAARTDVVESQVCLERYLERGDTVYGVNTGFGQLASVAIDESELTPLQENLLRSHATGVGEPLADAVVRLAMVLKVVALARGYSGVRPQLIDALCALISHGICPVVPSKGSVGASGDLAPLAHIAGALIGEGDASCNGDIVSGAEALDRAGLAPMALAPKEGLALLNGTQVSTALALSALFRTEHVLSASIIAGAMSADAIKGSDTPFDERIHRVRGHRGQLEVGALLRNLMQGSQIRASHLSCNRVQDPYSIRCQPQVIGACLDVLRHAAEVLQIEANGVTDNPLVFTDTDSILSGGNFHAEQVALVADYVALSVAEIGSLSERRIALLIDSSLSGLPAFLVEDCGLCSGFMMAQVTASALASENKSLAHPASVDSIPTSANQEDHVSMATFAARRLHDMLDNVAHIVAIELLAAAQGVEFHRPLMSSRPLENALKRVRAISARYSHDRSLSAEIDALARKVNDGAFCDATRSILPSMNS
ncbi:MAG: histidine ammonia-lyase [Rhodospirillaceae bacterium]|nr:histidine ammonia-lyase [Rhodospirillaceae bacterium]